MLLHQLPEDLVLALELRLEDQDLLLEAGLGGALSSPRALERSVALLEELLLPAVEGAGLELVLVAELRDGNLVDEVAAKDHDLLLGGAVVAFLSHEVLHSPQFTGTERLLLFQRVQDRTSRCRPGRADHPRPTPKADAKQQHQAIPAVRGDRFAGRDWFQ